MVSGVVRWAENGPKNEKSQKIAKSLCTNRRHVSNMFGLSMQKVCGQCSTVFCNFIPKSLVLLYIVLSVCSNLVVNVACDDLLSAPGARGHYTHTWAVHIPGGEHIANLVADEHNFINRGKVSF